MEEVYLLEGARTPFGRFGGNLKGFTDTQLGVVAGKAALRRSHVEATDIDEIIVGNVIHTQKSSSFLSRHIGLGVGMKNESAALTVNRLCGSGLQAVVSGAQSILLGDNQLVLAGGAENMSQTPFALRNSRFPGSRKGPELEDMLTATLTDEYIGCGMGITAENIAEKYSITREQQDEFALLSHNRATAAMNSGRLAKEIVKYEEISDSNWADLSLEDEHIRTNLSLDKLGSLKPAFKKNGTVTPGNASGINDGAALLVLGNKRIAANKTPLARIVSWAVAGVDPNYMGLGPVPSIQKAIEKASLTLSDIDLIEINEAFAAQYLGCEQELELDRKIVNVNGGAVAFGHPVGASGARILYTLALELKEQNKRYGVASLCIGGGQGIAVVLERV